LISPVSQAEVQLNMCIVIFVKDQAQEGFYRGPTQRNRIRSLISQFRQFIFNRSNIKNPSDQNINQPPPRYSTVENDNTAGAYLVFNENASDGEVEEGTLSV
jgi:hypothetical protein